MVRNKSRKGVDFSRRSPWPLSDIIYRFLILKISLIRALVSSSYHFVSSSSKFISSDPLLRPDLQQQMQHVYISTPPGSLSSKTEPAPPHLLFAYPACLGHHLADAWGEKIMSVIYFQRNFCNPPPPSHLCNVYGLSTSKSAADASQQASAITSMYLRVEKTGEGGGGLVFTGQSATFVQNQSYT